ncbi:MAG: DUF853 family protein [Clostridia bacterium]|nr:DUF853 family protein [Clostridia bacterium]
MYSDNAVWMASSDKRLYLLPKLANRHGLIAGATGTGKTITMKVMAESFSDMGVPVFFSDVKGDLSGTALPGVDSENMQSRIARFGIENFSYTGYPVRFWDIFGEQGIPVRVTVSQMGPILLSRLFGLSEVQAGVLNIVFRIADDNGLLLIDLKDLRAMLSFVGENRAEYTVTYGNVSAASIGAVQRALLAFENEGGADVFGEPALDIRDWMRTDVSGRGYINILSSQRLIKSPTVYATFLLWMLSELFEKLPEVGDPDKPRMVFFFDEAHMLFDGTPKALLQKITQIVKLIRSKGIGVYFVTQSPSDIPDEVLAQLSNKVQHGLRAYTPSEQKAVRAAAAAFRTNPAFKTEEVLMSLGTGEALVSFLDEKGVPAIVENARILPPRSLMGPAPEDVINRIVLTDEFDLKYREPVDRESAYEKINAAREIIEQERATEEEAAEKEKAAKKAEKTSSKSTGKTQSALSKTAQRATTSAASSVARSVSTSLVNSVTGGKATSGKTIAKRAASSALSSVLRSGTTSILRGLFGNKK